MSPLQSEKNSGQQINLHDCDFCLLIEAVANNILILKFIYTLCLFVTPKLNSWSGYPLENQGDQFG